MRTTTQLLLALTSIFALMGCDETLDDSELVDSDEDPSWRCGTGCTSGGLSNTSRIGDHAISNLAMTLGANAPNASSRVRMTGGWGYFRGVSKPITKIEVEADGELRLQLGTFWITGAAVKNARFNLEITPNDANHKPFTGELRIADVACGPGKIDSNLTICRYVFLTDVVPADPVRYPMDEKQFGYYHTCPNEDEQGQLADSLKYSAVLHPQVLLNEWDKTPGITPKQGFFVNGCLNGAVSKGQYHLNAFYDSSSYRGLQDSQRSAMLLMWMAWFEGKSHTIPGQKISPHDPLDGLFQGTNAPGWDIEAGYGKEGAICRGGSYQYGLHRNIVEPVLNLVGWKELPHCSTLPQGNVPLLVKALPLG